MILDKDVDAAAADSASDPDGDDGGDDGSWCCRWCDGRRSICMMIP